MNRLLRNTILLGTILLLLTACATPTQLPTPTIEITSTPIVIVVTATPLPATATPEIPTATIEIPTATLEPATNTAMPVKTYPTAIPGAFNADGSPIKSESSMNITAIKETGGGQAQIFWTASGTFSKGFRIYYSDYIQLPTFGGEKSEYAITDGATRSAYITGTPGTTYYYRMCSYTGSGCDFYSNLFTYTFKAATSTP